MELLGVYFVILFGHLLGDYVFQSRWQSLNKGNNAKALGLHTLVYSLTLTAAFIFGITSFEITVPFLLMSALIFFIIIYSTHFVVDLISTKTYNYLWDKGSYHSFFIVVGFEQLVHQYTILLALIWLVGF